MPLAKSEYLSDTWKDGLFSMYFHVVFIQLATCEYR